MWYLWHVSIRQQLLASQFTKPVYCMLLRGNLPVSGIALSIWDCFLWIDRSVSVTIGVQLPCIDRLLQRTLDRELLLQNYYNNCEDYYYNNVTVMSKRRVVNTLTLYEYVHANTTKAL